MSMYDFQSDPIGRIALMKVLEKRATIGGIFSNLGKTLYHGAALGRAIQAGFTGDPKAYENLIQNMKQLGTARRGLVQNTAGTALRVLPWAAMALPLGIGTVASMALSPFANSLANKIESGGRQGQAQMRPQQSQQMPDQAQMQAQPQQMTNQAQMQTQPQQMANPSQMQAQQLAINSPLNTQQHYLRMS